MSTAGAIHHVEIHVSDLPRSVAFRGWLLERLGYRGYQDWPEGRSWRLGESYIVLVRTRAPYRHVAYRRGGTGLNHIAFHAGSRAEVDLA
jgi:catechol 2,3-dioxygenase-like lactoylglutathione lyase family enzyme